MANIVSTQSIFRETQFVWNTVIGGYKFLPKEYASYIDTLNIDTYDYKVSQVTNIGMPSEVSEGENAPVASFQDYGAKIYRPKKYMLSVQITKEAMDFNLYKQDCPRLVEQFKRGFRNRDNQQSVQFLNNGWSVNPAYTGMDGQALFSPNHTVQNGSFANAFDYGTPLQENVLEAMITMMRRMLDTVGDPIDDCRAKTIIAPVDMQFQLVRLLQSFLRPGTGNNDINAIKFLDLLQDYTLSHYLSPTYFMIRTTHPGAMRVVNQELTNTYMNNPQNEVITSISSTRYIFFCYEPRAFVGAFQPLNAPAS
jgi:hypothetical protein